MISGSSLLIRYDKGLYIPMAPVGCALTILGIVSVLSRSYQQVDWAKFAEGVQVVSRAIGIDRLTARKLRDY